MVGGGSIIAERTGSGSNQLTIGPNLNTCLNFVSGTEQYPAHNLGTFLFVSRSRIPQGGLLWQRLLCSLEDKVPSSFLFAPNGIDSPEKVSPDMMAIRLGKLFQVKLFGI